MNIEPQIDRRTFIKKGTSALTTIPLFLSSNLSFSAPDLIVPKKQVGNLPHVTSSKLPRWRGFNLLEKFNGTNKPFREEDFRLISELGFNFVRLPMDYRCWIQNGDKRRFDEKTLSEIDQAVEFGKKYGIHVHLNFHRAPGYTVANPPESPTIWRDKETLDICKLHWQTFAKRYRNIPGDALSFNLFNEPAGCTEEEYFKVAKELVDAIRSESPDRLISCDGIDYGTHPCFSFSKLHVAQSTRGYQPMEISHFGASWVDSKNFPEPQWPTTSYNALLPAPNKAGLSNAARKPITLLGPFPNNSVLRFRIGTISNKARIVVLYDGKEAFNRTFVPSNGKGDWKEVVYSERYEIYQNIYDLDVELPLPAGTQKVSIANHEGDWATITKLGIVSSDKEAYTIGVPNWNAQSSTELKYIEKDGVSSITGGIVHDRQWLWDNCVAPWKKAEEAGTGVMVGEFGAHNVTPHSVVLHWMEDMLINWQKAGWGWALWNFRGSFGIADSGRKDVEYEDWKGLKLDRKLLELLQRY